MKIKLLSFLLLFAFSLSHATNKTDANRKTTTTTAFMPIVTIVSVNVEESDGVAQVPIQLDVIDTVDTIISITTVDGTADSGDYTSTVVTATIPAGQLEIFLNIPITDDLDGEPSEFFTVNGTVISGNTTNTNPSGTVTIGPSNTPTATVQDVTIGEGDGILPVVISLTNPSSVDTLIDITTVDGSAESPNDYQLTTTTATILSGDTSVTVNIPIIDDTISETNESFTVNITITSGNTQNATDSATMFITDNDDSVVSIGDVTVSEPDGTASVPVSIAGVSSVDTVIQITTTSGTANGLDDYVNTTVTATIPAFQSVVSVSIPIIDDTVSEPTEVFSVNGTVVSGNTSNTDPSGTVTITDDDDSFVSIGDVNISESDGTASVPVSIAGPSAVDTVISITTTDGSATDPDDYASLTVMVTIPAFQTSTSVSIPIIDDAISEPTEDFTVNGTVVSGNTINISPSGTVNIIDDDQVIFVINDISVMEDAGSITVPVTIQGVSSIDTNINITTTNDTATSPDDYTSVMTTVTIPALQSSINVVIPIIDDDVFETAEAFFIQGTVITGNTVNANDIATVSIIDDGSCGGGNIVGAPCDDGDPATLSDFIDENCNCIGEATEDVDGDGILNIEEVFNGTDYTDPCDPVQDIGYTGFDADNTVWQAGNCDNDDLNNALEIILGTDPYNTNYNTIQGNIAYDLNDDGCNGTDDLVFPFTRVDINDGTETTSIFTDNLGNYSFQATSGNYTITPNIENPTLYIATPANAIANFPITNNLLADEDFCITNNGSNPDVEIVISPIDFARPGFDASYWISYKNKGNEVISGDISLTYDEPLLDFINSTETISSQTPGVLNWTYTDLAPLESRNFYVRFNVNSPTETPPVNIDDQLVFTATINPIAGDILPDDNQFAYTQTVVGSYDPNDITCIQGNFVNPDQIGEYLHYVINFENTGNFFAQNVVVEMEIDPTQFNASTIRMLSTSHDASITVTGNIIRFIFQNILLEAGGHGNILLKIQSQDTLIEDDIVSNEANIFFDYNFPIQTNTETTAFTLSLDQVRLNNAINIYPNPTKEQLYISAKDAIKSIEIYDVQGRMLASEKYNTKNIALDMSAQAAGIYFVKIKTEKGIKTEKIVKM